MCEQRQVLEPGRLSGWVLGGTQGQATELERPAREKLWIDRTPLVSLPPQKLPWFLLPRALVIPPRSLPVTGDLFVLFSKIRGQASLAGPSGSCFLLFPCFSTFIDPGIGQWGQQSRPPILWNSVRLRFSCRLPPCLPCSRLGLFWRPSCQALEVC